MAETIHLLTPLTTYETLLKLAQGRGKTRIDRNTLEQLLIDHSVMFRALKNSSGFTVSEPQPPRRQRVRAKGT